MKQTLRCGRFELTFERPLVMGIVNVTPDSFSDGFSDFSVNSAIDHGLRLVNDGADMLDIGGESTRPGARPVPEAEELRRVLPVVHGLRDAGVPLSIDTFKPGVMQQVLDAGADMINDITAFRDPRSLGAVASSDCGLCVMHMQGDPQTMQHAPRYDNVTADIRTFLAERCQVLQAAGVHASRIMLDPGFGFGKTVQQNYELLRNLQDAAVDQFPWLLGVSRKSMIGYVTGRDPSRRLAGSIAAALAGVARGVRVVRVHDVAQTVDALRVWHAVEFGIDT